MLKILSCALLFVTIANHEANAAARSFSQPMLEGQRIASCLDGTAGCGKQAADAFCQLQGYSESILFQRQLATATISLRADNICQSGTCEAFSQIKCYRTEDAPKNLSASVQ